MLKRSRIAFVCALIAFVGALLLAKVSPSYRECDGARKQDPAYHETGNSQQERARRFLVCEGAFFDKNANTINAIATFGIFVFTITLWRATSRQAKLTRGAIKVSRKQAKIAQTQADLAREEFLASHRPLIVSLNFEESTNADGEHPTISACYRFVNSGDSEARLLEIQWHISFNGRPPRPGVTMQTRPLNGTTLAAGEEYQLFLQSNVTRENVDGAERENNRNQTPAEFRTRLRCVGRIVYADATGKKRLTGFSRVHDPSASRWDQEDNPDYDYSY